MWITKAIYTQLLAQLSVQQQRITALEQSLELERHENRTAERHWANALLRAKQSYPLQEKKAEAPVVLPKTFEQLVDPGELEALTSAARDMGFENPRAEAERILRAEQGLSN